MKGGAAQQIGAICYRTNEMGAVEVLLITTRDSGRWTIPKGWPIENLKPHQAAEREAWERIKEVSDTTGNLKGWRQSY